MNTELCPDCDYAELNADSEADEDGAYAVSCPNCGWHGMASEFDNGHSDVAVGE